jgi:lysophospholipid acyltransferase (LPLAT)-like uncharacterized protein
VKRFFRLGPVQSTAAFLLSVYIEVVYATMRWRFDQSEAVITAMAEPEGGLLFFWHGRIALAAVCRRIVRGRPMRVMISLSPDGEFISKAATRLGFPAIRGSTGRRAGVSGKGGAAAFMEALEVIAAGSGVIITPDGPRGPAEIMQAGPVMLAKRAGTRVFLAGVAARPARQLKTWDRMQLPLPFSRGCAVFEGPFRIGPDADRTETEAARAAWQAGLIAVQARAEAMLDETR